MKRLIFMTTVLLSIFLLTSCSAISQSQYDNVTAQLASAQAQSQSMINSNSAAQAAIQAFQSANATIQAQIQALQNANISAQSIIQGLQSDKAAALAQVQILQNANISAQSVIQGLQNDKAAAQAQVQTLQNACPAFMLTSSVFKTGEPLPVKYTQQGANVSPPFAWNSTPNGTQAFALLGEDIDGPTSIIVHWVIFNIPATARSLPEGVPIAEQLPDGTMQGLNNGRTNGFLGPSPPVGTTHRYVFTLFALDQKLSLNATTNRTAVISAMQGHILGIAQTMAAYKRP